MKEFKSHFWYTKRQRNGILVFLTILLTWQLILYFVDFSGEEALNHSEFALIQYQLDSMRKVQQADTIRKVRPFNPNYLDDFRGYQLGLSPEEIDRLLNYRKEGHFVNSDIEFQKITGISDSLLEQISVHFKFPDWVKESARETTHPVIEESVVRSGDLNRASVEQLVGIGGINLKLARRIAAYRRFLKGFSLNEQLFEVYDLDSAKASRILEVFAVRSQPEIDKLNLNEADFKSILHTPYLDYELTRKIFRYRDLHGRFQSLEDLKKIDSFPLKKFDRIALYLSAE